jgi:DUF1680 family protein
VSAQGGDQILDGIGETGLMARYTLKGDSRDWSRNNLHATQQGAGFRFVQDGLFGTVLSLPGNQEAFLSVPGESVSGEESVSITGWLFLRSSSKGQVLFDFGSPSGPHFLVSPSGTRDAEGYQALIQSGASQYVARSAALPVNKWSHVAIVLHAPSRTLSTYLNGERVAETTNVGVDLQQFTGNQTGTSAQGTSASGGKFLFYVGRSLAPGSAALDASLSDFRIYRIPLSGSQIARIYNNAVKKEQPVVRTREESDRSLPRFADTVPPLYFAFLKSVPDVQVETVTGVLPRLPRFVQGVYQKGIAGPEVRVLWPAPVDNAEALNPGIYTVTGRIPGTQLRPVAKVTVTEQGRSADMATVSSAYPSGVPRRALEVFPLQDVRLDPDLHQQPTPFIKNRDKFMRGLADTNSDDFLFMFRNAFGQEQPKGATPLGGWDSQQTKLRGHATGHYLTAIAQAYAGAGYDASLQADFGRKMEYIVQVLYELSQKSGHPKALGADCVSDPCSVQPGPGKAGFDSDLSATGIRTDYWNWGKGFVSAYPPDQFIMLERGATYGGSNAQIWAPYYTLHKILAGLLDVYEISGNEKALSVSRGMADWVYARLSRLPVSTLTSMWNRYIAGEYGGMNEVLARLHRLTGESRYLEAARLFDNVRVFFGDEEHAHGLAKNVDLFRGLHANQHIPQMLGALETYRVSGAREYYHIADNFWQMAVGDYMYSIGGVAGASNPNNAECFTAQPATLYENGFSAGGQNETCATYNMLKLASGLFLFDQDAAFMDYYERALYNHILASVAEDSPANTYHVPLRAGSVKQFGNARMNGFTCCNGTALESNTKFQSAIYFRSADHSALYVNLYVPSTLQWKEKGVTVKQTTDFPRDDKVLLSIQGQGRFDLNVRIPRWATKGFFVKINGKSFKVRAVPGNYLTLSRHWKDGDLVELQMPFSFYLEPVMDQPNIASLFYGPVLLAAQEPEPLRTWRQVVLDATDISKSISGDSGQLQFKIDGVDFKPFYDTYGRHSVYLDVRLK